MESEAEKAATSWANNRCPEQGPEFIVWTMCREDFLAGVAWERERFAAEEEANTKRFHEKLNAFLDDDKDPQP